MSKSFEDPADPTSEEAISALAEQGVLTERQAEIYVRRVLRGEPREELADELGIASSTVDGIRRRAEEKIEAAKSTTYLLERLESRAK